MPSSYTNSLRLELIASGEASGTWGTKTNTNLSLIADAFGFDTEAITTNADTHTTTIADGASDAGRAMYIKYTGTLDSECTITIGPNDLKRVHIIENATSGSQNIVISQGSGSNVTIPNGSVKVVYLTGDSSGNVQNVVDAFTDLDVAGTFKVAGNTTVGGTFTSTGAVTANAGVSIDNFNIDGTTIALSSGDMLLDGAEDIILDAAGGDVTLKANTTPFGSLTNTSGNLIIKSGTTTAATFSGANVTFAGTVVTGGLTTLGGNLVIPNAGNIGSVGDTDAISISSSGVVTLTQNLIIPDGGNIGSASDTDAIAISSGGVVTMSQIPIFSAGINVSGGSIAGSLSSTTQGNITATGALNSGSITSGFGAIDNGSNNISTTGIISFGSLTDGTTTITSVDQDISSVSSSHDTLATALAIKTYVDSQTVTATGIVGTGTGNTAIGTNALDAVQSTGNENTAFGFNAGTDISTGDNNVAVGFEALLSTGVGFDNVAIGHQAGKDITGSNHNVYVGTKAGKETTGSDNTAIGQQAFGSRTGNCARGVAVGYIAGAHATGDKITCIGAEAAFGHVTDTCDHTGTVAVGYRSLKNLQTGDYNTGVGYETLLQNNGEGNTALGYQAMNNFTTGTYNIGIGLQALTGNSSSAGTGGDNIGIGRVAGSLITSGSNNVMIGRTAMQGITSGDNNISIGLNSGLSGSPGGAQTTGDNKIFLGDSNISQFNCQVSLTAASDQRDKTDFKDLDIGLNFINSLKPYTFKWDKRINYVDKTKEDWSKDLDLDKINNDGTHKEDWLDIGFKAQEVEVLEKAAGYEISKNTNLTTTLSEDSKQYGLKYEKFVPILVKALQELSDKNDALEARIKTLEG